MENQILPELDFIKTLHAVSREAFQMAMRELVDDTAGEWDRDGIDDAIECFNGWRFNDSDIINVVNAGMERVKAKPEFQRICGNDKEKFRMQCAKHAVTEIKQALANMGKYAPNEPNTEILTV